MNDNPFSSPESGASESSEKSHRLVDARFGVAVAALFCGGGALLYLLRLVEGLLYDYPPAIETAPMRLVGYAIHAIGCALIAWRLVQYHSALESMTAADHDRHEAFVAAHASLWRTAMFVLLVFIVYRLAFTNFATW